MGRLLMPVMGAATTLGPYVVDLDETHVVDERRPHATSRRAQTMTAGLLIFLATLHHAWPSKRV